MDQEQQKIAAQFEQSRITVEMISLSHKLDLDIVAAMLQREDEWFAVAPILYPDQYRDKVARQRHSAALNVLSACRDFALTMRASHNPAEPEKPWDRLRKQREEAQRHSQEKGEDQK